MITGHTSTAAKVHDGNKEYTVKHSDFEHIRPGGIHPDIKEEWRGYIDMGPHLARGIRAEESPVPLVTVEMETHPGSGVMMTKKMMPIQAMLLGKYGRGEYDIISVPLEGDAQAQRLHWLVRNEEERAEMRAVLEYLGAWRLTDSGRVPQGT